MNPTRKLFLSIGIRWILVEGFTTPRPLRPAGPKKVRQVDICLNGCMVLHCFWFQQWYSDSVMRSFSTCTLTPCKPLSTNTFCRFLLFVIMLGNVTISTDCIIGCVSVVWETGYVSPVNGCRGGARSVRVEICDGSTYSYWPCLPSSSITGGYPRNDAV